MIFPVWLTIDAGACLEDCSIVVDKFIIEPVKPTSADEIPGVSLPSEDRLEERLESSGAASMRLRLPDDIDDDMLWEVLTCRLISEVRQYHSQL